jgi:hypothetical protein
VLIVIYDLDGLPKAGKVPGRARADCVSLVLLGGQPHGAQGARFAADRCHLGLLGCKQFAGARRIWYGALNAARAALGLCYEIAIACCIGYEMLSHYVDTFLQMPMRCE